MGHPAAHPQQVRANQDVRHSPRNPTIIFGSPGRRTLEACERELTQYRAMEIRLRDALAESEARLVRKTR